MSIAKLYEGELKECPRCKGHEYIKGQEIDDLGTKRLPDYKKIKAGICFLCDGTGEAFYTKDNRVLKCVKKYRTNYVIEYTTDTGKYIGTISSFKDDEKNDVANKKKGSIKELTSEVKEEDFFPAMYEMVWNDWSRVADVIFEEYPNARPVNIDKFYSDYEDECTPEDCVNFLVYYNEYGLPIKPFYVNPPYDTNIDNNSYKGIVMVNKDYIFAVSGTYIESKKILYLGIKTSREFKYYEVENVKCAERLDKQASNSDIRIPMFSLFLDKEIKQVSEVILKDVYGIIDSVSC